MPRLSARAAPRTTRCRAPPAPALSLFGNSTQMPLSTVRPLLPNGTDPCANLAKTSRMQREKLTQFGVAACDSACGGLFVGVISGLRRKTALRLRADPTTGGNAMQRRCRPRVRAGQQERMPWPICSPPCGRPAPLYALPRGCPMRAAMLDTDRRMVRRAAPLHVLRNLCARTLRAGLPHARSGRDSARNGPGRRRPSLCESAWFYFARGLIFSHSPFTPAKRA